jgi:NAD(P)-dependent dehydrogenase (short-subunit alcohol dehydrogenase family)
VSLGDQRHDSPSRVVGLDLSVDRAPRTEGVSYLAADVTDSAQVRAALAVVRRMPLRIVVNCAGIGPSARILGRQGVHDLDLYSKVIWVNLIGTFTVMALAAEAMAQTEPLEHGQRGVIINNGETIQMDGALRMAPR